MMINDGQAFDYDESGNYPVSLEVSKDYNEYVWYYVNTVDGGYVSSGVLQSYTYSNSIELYGLQVGEYSVTLNSDTYGPTYAGFSVVEPDFIAVTSPSAQSFYPRVVDGYLDRFVVNARANQGVTGQMDIQNSAGKTVFTTIRRGTSFPMTWNGRNQRGVLVPVGKYVATGSLVNSVGDFKDFRHVVTVKTDTVVTKKRVARWGYQTSKRARSGDCYMTDYEYSEDLDINCMAYSGRGAADVRWTFKVPAKSKVTAWRITGELRCCAQGIFKKSIIINRNFVTLRLQLSGLRAFTAETVGLSFKYPRQR